MGEADNRRRRRCGRLAAAAVTVALARPSLGQSAPPSLTWDAPGTSPATGHDGSGSWNTPGNAVWANGTADVAWTDGAAATIGTGTGSAPYTISLAANVSAASVEFDDPGPGASYTLNGNGHTLAVPNGSMTIASAQVTFVNGTFTFGDATSANLQQLVVGQNGTLTLGGGSTLAVAVLSGDIYAPPSTIYFDGGTFRPLANTAAVLAGGNAYTALSAFSTDYMSTGGLKFDTTAVASGITYVTDGILHDQAVAGPDGGLTLTGGGQVQLGFDIPSYHPTSPDPLYTYTGATTVTGNSTLRLNTQAGTAAITGVPGTGPFPNTQFVVNAGSTLAVGAPDGVVGETGTTPVTLNGGTLKLVNGASADLATVTLNGGAMTADAAGDRFTFLAGGELHATANATVSGASLAFNPGSDLRADAGATVSIASPVVDGDTPGQLTTAGAGAVVLSGANTYTGPTNVSAGSVTLSATGSLAGTPSIRVASGAALSLLGSVGGSPALNTTGTVTLSPVAGPGVGLLSLGAVTIGTGGLVSVTPSATSVTRTLLVTSSLAISAGKLDLGNGDLDLTNATPAAATAALAALQSAAASGFAGGLWTGNGLASAAAAADSRHLTAIGLIANNTSSGAALYTSFDGQPVAATDLLARYTYYGDTNLDGAVTAADYTRVDAGFLLHLAGWANGDFNYDGAVDGSDYTLMDNAFNQQLGGIASPADVVEAPLAAPAAVLAVVPEPATLGLAVLLGASGLLPRRRR